MLENLNREGGKVNAVNEDLDTKSIFFKNLTISPRRVSLTVSYSRGEFPIWYEFDRDIITTPSLVALAVAPLCGRAFDLIVFDFEITADILEAIRLFTGANVEAPTAHSEVRPPETERNGTILSFSGGFDSIAAKALMPADTHLVSLDLGGWFKREAEYFGRFNPIIVKTNIRQVPDQLTALTANNWLFMASGTILCSYHLSARYHVFGSILGERFNFPAAPRKLPLLEAIGLFEAPVTAGITEIGTTKIMLQTHWSEVADSLVSLANSGDRKQYYKQAMVTLLSEELNIENPLGEFTPEWERKISFDQSYTSALSTLYFAAKNRIELIEPLYENIPSEVIEFGKSRSMDFLTKVNYDFYESTPKQLRNHLFSRLSALDLIPYSEHDWTEVQETRAFLSRWF